jgi:hypothetical protein
MPYYSRACTSAGTWSPSATCDDGHPCTTDGCTTGTPGCTHTGVCTNGQECVSNIDCTSGNCSTDLNSSAGSPRYCALANQCAGNSTSYAIGAKLCPSNWVGTAECTATGWAYTSCNDGNVCTSDACSSGSCTHTPLAGACDPGEQCKVGACSAGSCVVTGNVSDGTVCYDSEGCPRLHCTNGVCG